MLLIPKVQIVEASRAAYAIAIITMGNCFSTNFLLVGAVTV